MSNPQLSLHEAYLITNSLTGSLGIPGYKIHRQYIDPNKIALDRQMLKIKKGGKPRQRPTKRGSFIDDEIKLHKLPPGPGKYPFADDWPEKKKLKTHFADRMTYIQEIMKQQKKQKRPAPGFYNIFKSLKELEKERKQMAIRKVVGSPKKSYLDSAQCDASSKPGVGNYNIRGRSQTQTSFSKFKTKPEDWRKKHTENDKKKRAKTPNSTTYSPKPSDYSLFSTMRIGKSKNGFGKMIRFKTAPSSGSGINPAKYSVLQKWRGKENTKEEKHGLQVLSRSRAHTSVYHD